MGAANVIGASLPVQEESRGSSPTAALQTYLPKDILVHPIPTIIAKSVCESKHYLHSFPGGSMISFGISGGEKLLGVAVLGVGPANAYRLLQGAKQSQVICLTRLWLDDRLGRNCESHTLAVILRALKRKTNIKALVAYSDPAAGHNGTIYRAAGFLYLGESEATPLLRMPDGVERHSRSVAQVFGTHSIKHFASHGIKVELVPQSKKLIYICLLDSIWRERLTRKVLTYPKIGEFNEHC